MNWSKIDWNKFDWDALEKTALNDMFSDFQNREAYIYALPEKVFKSVSPKALAIGDDIAFINLAPIRSAIQDFVSGRDYERDQEDKTLADIWTKEFIPDLAGVDWMLFVYVSGAYPYKPKDAFSYTVIRVNEEDRILDPSIPPFLHRSPFMSYTYGSQRGFQSIHYKSELRDRVNKLINAGDVDPYHKTILKALLKKIKKARGTFIDLTMRADRETIPDDVMAQMVDAYDSQP